nr:alpha/beta fold hydrolase [Candidatus Njordarchaeota archaeon]
MSSGNTERVKFVSGGQHIVGVIHLPHASTTKGKRIVITCHGFMSSKDSQKYLQIAQRFLSCGIAVLRFDFRGSGESEGTRDLLGNRITDLKAAIEYATERGFKSIGVLGSSFGGATAILVTAETPNVGALVTWSTPCQFIELFEPILTAEIKDYEAALEGMGGEIESSEFIEDLSKHSVIEAVKRVNKILTIHCKGDKVVPWTQAKLIFENAQEPKQLKVFEKGDHQLLDPSIRGEAIELSLKWFMNYL